MTNTQLVPDREHWILDEEGAVCSQCGQDIYHCECQESKKTVLKVVCSYCGVDMGEKDGEGIEGTSHSICKTCLNKEIAEPEGKRR